MVELVASGGFRHGQEDEPANVKALGSSIGVLSVGGAIACAYAVGRLVGGFAAWPLGSLVATSAYLLLFGAEPGLAERLRRGRVDKSG